MDSLPRSPVRFGAFELDRQAGQLTRSGRRVHLAPQALRVLTLLTDKVGQVVTREDIRAALWGNDTFVDFETAVNACVSQLRSALGDKATAPRFIETLPRRGYRFVAPVVPVVETTADERASDVAPGLPSADSAAAVPNEPSLLRGRRIGAWISVALAAVVVALVWTVLRASPQPAASEFARTRSLTAIQKLERGASGLADASPGELLDRVKHFETAIAQEPEFAEAYAGLAEAKLIIASYRAEAPQVAYSAAKAAAAKALSLNPNLGQAHASYAAAALLFEWDWETARAHLARAEALAPSSPRVHHWKSRYLTARGRHAEALQHARRAHSLAPTSPSALTNVGVAAFYGANPTEPRRWCGRAAALMREFVPAHLCLAAIDAQIERPGSATPEAALAPAVNFASSGDKERAIDWLQLAANRRTDALVFAGVQPAFAALRSDPRFLSVLERVGLRPTNLGN